MSNDTDAARRDLTIAECNVLRQENAELRSALGCFFGDVRYQVAVGGNPIVVDRMLDHARALLARGAK